MGNPAMPHGAHKESVFIKGNTSGDLCTSFITPDGTGRDGFVFHTQNFQSNKYAEPLTAFHRNFDPMLLTAPATARKFEYSKPNYAFQLRGPQSLAPQQTMSMKRLLTPRGINLRSTVERRPPARWGPNSSLRTLPMTARLPEPSRTQKWGHHEAQQWSPRFVTCKMGSPRFSREADR